MIAIDRLNEIEARAKAADKAGVFESDFPTWDAWEAAWDSSTDVPALVAALRAVLDLHRESRNDVDHTPPCEHCHGEPGVHACGCWADEKWPTVCAVCMEGTKGASVAWPCPTVRAIEEALS